MINKVESPNQRVIGILNLLTTSEDWCASGGSEPASVLTLLPVSRNCPREIMLLVWRIVPQVKPGLEGFIRRSSCKSTYDLQSPPNKREKNSMLRSRPPEHRQSCHVVYDGNDGLVLNGWERYTELGKVAQHTTLPPHSRPASIGGDKNYILLAPLNPGSQVDSLE